MSFLVASALTFWADIEHSGKCWSRYNSLQFMRLSSFSNCGEITVMTARMFEVSRKLKLSERYRRVHSDVFSTVVVNYA
jgi:hypothetical protein